MKLHSKNLVITIILGIVFVGIVVLFSYITDYFSEPILLDSAPEEYVFSLSISDKRDVGRGYTLKEGNLFLSLRSERGYDCAGYLSLALDAGIKENAAKIEILGIKVMPEIKEGIPCPESLGWPFGFVDLGPPRALELSFVLGSKVDIYQISFERGSLAVEPAAGLFTAYESRL